MAPRLPCNCSRSRSRLRSSSSRWLNPSTSSSRSRSRSCDSAASAAVQREVAADAPVENVDATRPLRAENRNGSCLDGFVEAEDSGEKLRLPARDDDFYRVAVAGIGSARRRMVDRDGHAALPVGKPVRACIGLSLRYDVVAGEKDLVRFGDRGAVGGRLFQPLLVAASTASDAAPTSTVSASAVSGMTCPREAVRRIHIGGFIEADCRVIRALTTRYQSVNFCRGARRSAAKVARCRCRHRDA
jgi:hypothetical protein